MTKLIFCYFFSQIQNLLDNDIWKNAKILLENIIFQKILNLVEKVAKYQVCHLRHKNESPFSSPNKQTNQVFGELPVGFH